SRPTGDSGRPPGRRRTRRRQLRLVGVLLAAWLVFLIGTPVFALARMDRVDQSQSDARPPRQPGTATLLVGSDARDPGPGYEPVPGDEDLTTARADTIMLLYQPRSGRPVLVSLPRDSYVPIPDLGQDKLNAAYAYGGPALLTETVEQVTGVRIDGYLEIGFDGFSRVVDAVGGVEVCTDIALQDDLSGLDIPAGCTQLDGQQALAYVRMRYADPRGDIGRAERQREIIGKVVGKAASPVSVLNPVRYWSLNMAAADMVTKGDQTGPLDLLGSARALIGVAGRDGLSLVVPIADPSGVSDTGASVVIWDRENALALFDEISRGDTSQLDRFLG
ncbi:MAG: LCP family protein, partial [Brooklawnia sp.]|uniref:LCP family protein n=1 Tax=Brooklawnia sp. TaxID=2699740 RepID=UPI003C70F50A